MRPAPIIRWVSILIGDHVMATDNTATATPESPETFDGLMIRFESAAYRLRLAAEVSPRIRI
jgi:hypothetical protein